jgi:peptidoglycan/xylan/chitin deacetylase (PgdA/CDA1 family)
LPGYLSTVHRLQRRAVAIVMYHGIVETPPPFYNWCLLDAAEFARQIGLLAERYTILPLDEVLERWQRAQPLPDYTACVTFDDGFRSVATLAFPILERRQVPSTVFLTTGVINTGKPSWAEGLYSTFAHTPKDVLTYQGTEYPLGTPSDRAAAYRSLAHYLKNLDSLEHAERLGEIVDSLGEDGIPPEASVLPLDWGEVDRLAQTGLVKFGSHAHTHPILSRCSVKMQRQELEMSRDILRERRLSADLFAYPNGSRADFTADTQRLLRELGYRCGLTTILGLNRSDADRYALRRVQVGADTLGRMFEIRLAGH